MRSLLAALMLLCLPVLAMAQPFSNPSDTVAALYAGYIETDGVPGVSQRALQSDRLNALFDKDAAEAAGEMGRIDFDPYINAQDFDITEVNVREAYLAGGRAVVQVSFRNFGVPQNLGFMLVNENGGWKIDDVWGAVDGYSYNLLDILQKPMP